jgi:hypothetical protein
LFHVRIALDREKEQRALTNPPLAQEILDSAKFYQASLRWHVTLFLLMPDHLHGSYLLRATNGWAKSLGIGNASMRESIILSGKKDISIIDCDLTNVVRTSQRRWITSGRILWLLVYVRRQRTGLGLSIHSHSKVDRLLRKMPVRSKTRRGELGPMARGSPKAQEYQAAERALFSQRVEDNAFHLG